MAFPKQNFSTSKDGSGTYATTSGAVLKIESVIGDNRIVEFKAFLTTLNQNFSSTWNSEDVYGRNDPIATFQGTQENYIPCMGCTCGFF
jgi:calcineurin-like phosphoesterase